MPPEPAVPGDPKSAAAPGSATPVPGSDVDGSDLRRAGRGRASGVVAAGIFLSRISGLAREAVIAAFFGASGVADAWRAALRAPNVLQNLLGEGTLSASFVPVYSEMLGEGRREDAARFAGAALGLVAAVAGALALVGVFVAPLLVGILYAGFDPERQALTVGLVRILFPMVALLVVSAWALGVLNSHRRFFLPYVAPVGWNASMIAAMLVGATVLGLADDALVRVLAWGALVGGGVQLVVQLPSAIRLVGGLRPSLSLDVPGVRDAIRGFVPVVAARGAVNVSGYLDYFLATYLAVGAIAVLGYAQTLYLLPISLFALSVAASELPEMARDRLAASDRIAGDVGRGLERVLWFLVPSTVAYLFLGDVLIAALLSRGRFGPDEVRVTWIVLAAYTVGMSASALSRLLASAFYALRDTRTPARVAYARVALSTVAGLALMFPFDRYVVGELRLGAAGLAVGASVGAWTEWALLTAALRRRIGALGVNAGHLARILVAAAAAGAVGVGLDAVLASRPWIAERPWILAAGTLVPFGGVYLATTAALGVADPVRALVRRPARSPGTPPAER